MESLEEVQKQLNGLVMGIRECNFIPWIDKQDIVQSSFLKVFEKMNEGVIVDDAKQIRGYVFQILRNQCLAYHRDKYKYSPMEIKWDIPDDTDTNKEEYQKELKSVVEKKIQSVRYSEVEKKLISLTLSNITKEEVIEELGITTDQYRRMRQGVLMRLKNDLKKKPKYVIKHREKEWIQVPCYTSTDVKDFLKNHTLRQVKSIIYDGMISSDGYYVEILHKIVRKR